MSEVSPISLSVETHNWLPGAWCLDWVSPSEHEPSSDLIKSAQPWISDGFGRAWGWPGIMFDHAWAVQIQQRVGTAHGFTLVGIACREVDRAKIFQVTGPPPQVPGFSPEGEIGLHQACQSHRDIPQGHSILGWEAIMIDHMSGLGESLIEDGQLLEVGQIEDHCREQNAHPLNGCWPWFPLALLSVPLVTEEM